MPRHCRTREPTGAAGLICMRDAKKLFLMALLLVLPAIAAGPAPWVSDQGDGTYRNPVLHADYSDPDAVRVGDDYWMTASSFSQVPGLPVLHSRDLVNWELVAHALPKLVPEDAFRTPQHGKGVWAPAIRHHAGKFWIYYPDPDHGIYLVTATDPRGPWSEPVLVKGGKGLIDPCPLWDEDGKLYLVHAWARSRAGFANVLTLLELDPSGTRVTKDHGVVVNGDQIAGYSTLEGPKFLKREGWYYIFAPAGGVATGWQSVFRAKDIRGPYEARVVLAQGASPTNGPHQGAAVDTPSGDWWFLHFQDKGAYGRIVHLQPMAWRDGWPVMGTALASPPRFISTATAPRPGEDTRPVPPASEFAAAGEPVLSHPKPRLASAKGAAGIVAPPTSDEFSSDQLGLQWQWQANPQPGWFSLSARPGHLRLVGEGLGAPMELYDYPRLLLQKFPAPEFTVTTKLELPSAQASDRAGLVVFGYAYSWIGLHAGDQGTRLVSVVSSDVRKARTTEVANLGAVKGAVWLRAKVREGAIVRLSWSTDGTKFHDVGGNFQALPGRWVGAKVGLFASGAGQADFDFFRVE